jgi:antitoxin ParD1/3/4
MPTRKVVLTDYQAELVERLVSSGRYQNASEVLREGLRLVEDQETEVKAPQSTTRCCAHRDRGHRGGTVPHVRLA